MDYKFPLKYVFLTYKTHNLYIKYDYIYIYYNPLSC